MGEMDETQTVSVGDRLRVAREEKGLTLEDVASQTRIPRRHLESIETGDWSNLPAPTYTIGFAKSYATAVELDRDEIGDQLRAEMGGARTTATDTEVFEAADPARTMPKSLVLIALLAVIVLVAGLSWYNRRSLESADEPQAVAESAASASGPTNAAATAPAPTPVAQGPVVLTANEPVWLQVYEKGGKTLFQGELAAGQRYDVPPTATAPMLKTGKPEALRISVGTADAPPVGPAATTVRDVSLLGPDLMKAPQPAATSAPAAATTE